EIAQCLEGIAVTLGRDNAGASELDAAARLYGAAAAVRAAIGAPQTPSEAVAIQAHVAQVRAILGEGRFVAAWAQGEHGSIEEAVAVTWNSGSWDSTAPAKALHVH